MRCADLLGRLEKVKQNGADRWMACCPAHDDKTPSLSLQDTTDRILLHCFAGCDTEAITRALDITPADLFFERRESEQKWYDRTYRYDDSDPKDVNPFFADIMALESVEEREPVWLIDNVLAQGFMTLIAGDAGTGKTTLAVRLAAELTKAGHGVLYLSPEVNFGLQMKQQVKAAGGNGKRIYVKGASFVIPEHISDIKMAMDLAGADVVIIDTMLDFVGSTDTWREAEVAQALLPLREAIMNTDRAALWLSHMRKAESDKKQYKVAGSTQVIAQFHQVLGLYREDEELPSHLRLEVIKSNISKTHVFANVSIDPLGPSRVIASFPEGRLLFS